MKLNARRRKILKALALVLALMLVFPPFILTVKGSTASVGYSLFIFPPTYRDGLHPGTVNAYLLALQYLFAMTIGGIAFLLADDESE